MVLATGPVGKPPVSCTPDGPPTANLLLAGVGIEHQGTPEAVGLYSGARLALRDRGAQVAESVISAANTAVVNLYAGLGFRFGSLTVNLHRQTGPLERTLEAKG